MLKKHVVAILVVGIVNLFFASSALAGTNESKKEARAEKVKTGIAKLGIGPEAKVKVKLYDKTKIKGYVAEADDDSFVVGDEKTGVRTDVLYSNAKQIKGKNLNTGVKIAIGVAILVGIALLVAIGLRD